MPQTAGNRRIRLRPTATIRGARWGLLLLVAVSASGCVGLRQVLGRDGSPPPTQDDSAARAQRAGQRAGQGTPVTGAIPDPIVAEPADPEPEPAASDSAGVARLLQLATVWHTVSLHHPWVATRGVPWDSALIIAAPRVRAATSDNALAVAYGRLLSLLRDPLSRVEPALPPMTVPVPVTAEYRDSVLVLRIAPTASFDTNDSALVAGILASSPSRVLLDLRGSPSPDPLLQATKLERFMVRTGLQNQLVQGIVASPVERTRRVGVWPAGARVGEPSPVFQDGWDQPESRIITGTAVSSPKIVMIADSSTVLPSVLVALQSHVRAYLIADGPLRDAVPVTRVRIPINAQWVVSVRTGELVQSDGSVDVQADTVISSGGNAEATAIALLRSNTPLPFAPRAALMHRTPAATPVFYDSARYPYMGARLLGGFRLWSAMRARHAHRDLYDDDLDAVFARVIPQLEAARSAAQYASAIAELAASLDDVEGVVRGASFDDVVGAAALPFRVRSAERRAFITDVLPNDVTTQLQLVPGTEILSVDGYPLPAWLSDHRRVMPASNDWTQMHSLMGQLVRGRAGEIMVKVKDLNNRDRTVMVPRSESFRTALPVLQRPRTPAVHMMGDGIAYVDVEQLSPRTIAEALTTMRAARGVVLDLRGALQFDDTLLLAPLATRPHALVARVVQRSVTTPCFASIREATVECADVRETRSWRWPHDTISGRGDRPRLVALIDERTQGAMERLAFTLDQVATVTFLGSASAGSLSWTTPLSLPGGLTVGIATQEVRRADGGQVQRVGLTPMVDAHPTARGLKAGEDEVLSRARLWMQQQLDPPTRRRR